MKYFSDFSIHYRRRCLSMVSAFGLKATRGVLKASCSNLEKGDC
jgi:hypothetical protein